MIRAHEQGGVLTVDVGGPATMVESPAVSELATERVSHGARTIRIDLRDCTTMDSTFTGTLLSLLRQLEKVGGKLTLVSPSVRVVELLQQMGLEDFYEIETSERIDGGSWNVVGPLQPSRPEKLERLILDAHDELARLPGSTGRTFRVVVDELRRPLSRPASSKAPASKAPISKAPASKAPVSKAAVSKAPTSSSEKPAPGERNDGPDTMRTAGFGQGTAYLV